MSALDGRTHFEALRFPQRLRRQAGGLIRTCQGGPGDFPRGRAEPAPPRGGMPSIHRPTGKGWRGRQGPFCRMDALRASEWQGCMRVEAFHYRQGVGRRAGGLAGRCHGNALARLRACRARPSDGEASPAQVAWRGKAGGGKMWFSRRGAVSAPALRGPAQTEASHDERRHKGGS